ncbi:MAG: O-antigen ligase family protein [Planctomycetaceae bacterium]
MRMIAILLFYTFGSVLGLMLPAMACCFYIINDIFRPLDFAYRVLEFPAVHLTTLVLVASVFLRRTPKRWNTMCTVLAVITVWLLVCGVFSPMREFALSQAWHYAKLLLPLLLVSCVLTNRWSQNMFIGSLAYSVGIWSAQAGMHGLMTGQPQIGMGIPGAQMTERNDFMVGCVTAIPLLFYVSWNYQGPLRLCMRLGTRVMAGLSVAALVFSLSRGGVVGFGLMTLYYVFRTGRASRRLIGITILLLGATFFVPEFLLERMGTIDTSVTEQTEGSAKERLEVMQAGIQMALDNPVLGVGSSSFIYIVPRYGINANREPHSIWIKSAAEYGFPMLLFFLVVIAHLLRSLARRRKAARLAGDRTAENMCVALGCAIVGFLGSASFTNTFLSEYFWAIVAVSGAFLADPATRGLNPERTEAEESKPGTPVGAGPRSPRLAGAAVAGEAGAGPASA